MLAWTTELKAFAINNAVQPWLIVSNRGVHCAGMTIVVPIPYQTNAGSKRRRSDELPWNGPWCLHEIFSLPLQGHVHKGSGNISQTMHGYYIDQ